MPLTGAYGKDDRCEPAQARVRPHGVVVDAPGFDDLTRGRQAGEQMLIEALIAQSPDEALGKAVLHRLAWGDVMPQHAMLLLPAQDGVRGQLSAIVADNQLASSEMVEIRPALRCGVMV